MRQKKITRFSFFLFESSDAHVVFEEAMSKVRYERVSLVKGSKPHFRGETIWKIKKQILTFFWSNDKIQKSCKQSNISQLSKTKRVVSYRLKSHPFSTSTVFQQIQF